jgi:hypothetical protein
VGPRTGLDDMGKENSCPYRDSNSDSSVVQPVPVAIPTALPLFFIVHSAIYMGDDENV